MRIKSVLRILREIKYIKSILKRYRFLLAPGKYILFDNFRSMALNNEQTLAQASKYFGKSKTKSRRTAIVEKINRTNFFVNHNKGALAEYEAFYIANNYDKKREIKLFSFKKNKILIICTSSDECEKQILQYNLFGNAYNMPKVQKNANISNSLDISMVDLMEFSDVSQALRTIVSSTIQFHSLPGNLRKVRARDLTKYSYGADMDSLLEKLCSAIDDDILNMEIPLCVQHGDLSKENLIYGESEGKVDFWWIDWEHAGDRIFFYDLFFYIINSAFYDDTSAYDFYMSGGLDEDLKKFFAHFGVEFISEKREDYFRLFALIFLKERVCDFGYVEALKQYCEFIDAHSGDKNEVRIEK